MKSKIPYLFFLILFFSDCTEKATKDGSSKPETEKKLDKSNIAHPFQSPIVNVYIENSGSMRGYLNGYTEFKDALTNYLTDIEIAGIAKSFNLYFINKTVTKVGSNINTYLESITQSSIAPTSDIALIFQNVLSKTDKNTISIFVSDCIFSPEKNKNASSYLLQQQSNIKASVAAYLQKFPNTSITVYQLTSKFSGTYYNSNDQQTILKNTMRPYYIWVVGNVEHIGLLKEKVKDTQFKGGGVKHSYTLCPPVDTKMNYAILSAPKFGSFERDKKSPKTSIFDIEKANSGKGSGEFMFTIGMDLGLYSTLLGNDYLMEPQSYKILVDEQPNLDYQIKVTSNKNTRTDYTHNIQLSTNKISDGKLNIELINNLPLWIIAANDDLGLNIHTALDKTFGIKYLVEGVFEAYTYRGYSTYAIMKLNLKR